MNQSKNDRQFDHVAPATYLTSAFLGLKNMEGGGGNFLIFELIPACITIEWRSTRCIDCMVPGNKPAPPPPPPLCSSARICRHGNPIHHIHRDQSIHG